MKSLSGDESKRYTNTKKGRNKLKAIHKIDKQIKQNKHIWKKMDKKRKEMKYNNLTFIKQTDIVIFHKTCRITKLLSTAEESEFIAIVSNSFPFYNRIAIYNKRHFYYLQRIANSLSSASGRPTSLYKDK